MVILEVVISFSVTLFLFCSLSYTYQLCVLVPLAVAHKFFIAVRELMSRSLLCNVVRATVLVSIAS